MGTLVYSKLVLSVPVTRKKKMPDIWSKLYVSTLSFLLATFLGGGASDLLLICFAHSGGFRQLIFKARSIVPEYTVSFHQ